jgi:hypothetical protein
MFLINLFGKKVGRDRSRYADVSGDGGAGGAFVRRRSSFFDRGFAVGAGMPLALAK